MSAASSLDSRRHLARQREEDARELERLRAMEADLSTPILELAHQLERLRRIEQAAEQAMAKVGDHERKGYDRIRVGAFAALREALED